MFVIGAVGWLQTWVTVSSARLAGPRPTYHREDIDREAWTVRWRGELDKAGRENVVPLTDVAIEVINGLAGGIGDTPLFPASKTPSKPVSRHTCNIWIRRAKDRWLKSVPEDEREALKARLHRVGFHADNRAGIRDPRFRSRPPKVQEAISGKTFDTIKDVYDDLKRTRRRRGSGP